MDINWVIQRHASIGSTQDSIREMAEAGGPEGMAVQALRQTKGQGRHGREWISDPGNLYLSVLLRPRCPAGAVGGFSLMAGIAVGTAIRSFLEDADGMALKWPNDVLIGGEKCAGILIETGLGAGHEVEWAALGIGVNVKSPPPGLGTCIGNHSADMPEPENVRDKVLECLDSCYRRWQNGGLAEIRREWLDMAHKKGTPVQVRIGSRIERGIFYDVDGDGALLLQDNDLRLRRITAGDVYLQEG